MTALAAPAVDTTPGEASLLSGASRLPISLLLYRFIRAIADFRFPRRLLADILRLPDNVRISKRIRPMNNGEKGLEPSLVPLLITGHRVNLDLVHPPHLLCLSIFLQMERMPMIMGDEF